MIARIHDGEDLAAFFDHELFHLYQAQVRPSQAGGAGSSLYEALWNEGLATWVSHALNPQVSQSQVLGRPADLAERARPLLPQIARQVLQNLDSTSPQLYRKFFLGHQDQDGYPPRSGYYLGYLVAEQLSQGHNLQEMARWHGPELEARIRAVLVEMAGER